MNLLHNLEKPTSIFDTDDADATGLENQDSDSEEGRLSIQALDLEKKVEGEKYSQSTKHQNVLHSVISSSELECLAQKILLLFGEDCEFEKEMLIQLWMALGVLMEEPMEEIGANYFEKLVSEEYILCSTANSFYKLNAEKLSTEMVLIRDVQSYIVWDSGSQNEYNDASTETLHVSVLCDEIDETIFKKLGRFNQLRSLLFLGNYGSSLQQVPRDLFMRYESLVALDLSGTHIRELPSSTRKMIHLRYLDLSWTLIELLPERIGRFRLLQTLKLKEEGLKITELKYLDNLAGEFCIANLENVHYAVEAVEASLIAKRNIKKLELRWSRHHFQGPKNQDEAIIENLHPCSDLEEIQILCYHGTCLPSWIADVSFHKLVSITLLRCENVSVLPSLERLPSLKSLELVGLNSVKEMNGGGGMDHVAFPELQKLAIDGMLNLETWTNAQGGDYPSLFELSVRDCPKLSDIPCLFHLPSLKHLEVSGCTKLAFVSEKQLSISLQQLVVEDCPSIKERCSKDVGQDWYKIQHVPTIWIDQVAIQQAYEDDKEAPSEDDDESDW